MYLFTATTGYNYSLGSLRSNTSLSFFYQDSKLILDTLDNASMNQTYSLNQGFSFKIPLSITFGASYSKSEFASKKMDIIMSSLSGTYSAFKGKWQNTLGVKYSSRISDEEKLGYFWDTRVRLWDGGDLSIRIENNIYQNYLPGADDFNEFIASLSFEVRW